MLHLAAVGTSAAHRVYTANGSCSQLAQPLTVQQRSSCHSALTTGNCTLSRQTYICVYVPWGLINWVLQAILRSKSRSVPSVIIAIEYSNDIVRLSVQGLSPLITVAYQVSDGKQNVSYQKLARYHQFNLSRRSLLASRIDPTPPL